MGNSEGDFEGSGAGGVAVAGAGIWLVGGLVVAGMAAVAAYTMLISRVAVPTADVAGDPLLERGFLVYRRNCLTCHGERGEGDGTSVTAGSGLNPANLSAGEWKRGEDAASVLRVIAEGVERMPGFGGALSEEERRAVAAYTFHLAGKGVPAELRSGEGAVAGGGGEG